MAQPQNIPIVYSINEASRISSIGRTRLYELINDGSLKVKKLGRRTLINAKSLHDLLEPEV